jgi:hypothetical protein
MIADEAPGFKLKHEMCNILENIHASRTLVKGIVESLKYNANDTACRSLKKIMMT